MIAALVLAVVLIAVVAIAVTRVRALEGERRTLESERARLAAEGEQLRAQLAERRRDVDELIPYRDAVDAAEDWIWATDEDGTVRFSSPAAGALLGRDELLGVALSELTHPDDQAVGWSGVLRRKHADGSWRTVDSRSVRAGRGWQGIDRDLTAAPPASATPGVAVVRLPVVDGRREVIAYELIGDGDVLGGFSPAALLELGAGRPVWVGLDTAAPPELDRSRTVLQVTPSTPVEQAVALTAQGFALALDGFDGAAELLDHCGIVKVGVAGREDEDLRALLAEPASRGLTLVATGVAGAEEFTRCRLLGFSHFQGEFFARPAGEQGGGGAIGSLQALGELTTSDASFEQLERIISADVGLSVGLLRHVNSAFFALPRKIDTVREALTLLGPRAVRRWATVVALSSVPEAPDQLVALALLRGRMCELLGRGMSEEERDRLFTVGLFSVADALLDASMEHVLETLPFSDEITGALLRLEGPLGRTLGTVLRYEQGHFPETGDPAELAEAYLGALKWADDAGRWVAQ
ncbi:HDOD domain-containing protein [Solirubrobacter ginsenosidimutans]|uniref:HDOD domain-containing protein n=1 Tax=Solirubrobacter ginsenosidimutans TaxID=490573 RepID=A0A9X3N0V7_9ACTN|nr:HDOD domain-containing protein [Solirubrobacter ginsenosidimutans]MDA0166167.1 HDOD domain-containing protein [Solirubrobacter ginsenosidimutans]